MQSMFKPLAEKKAACVAVLQAACIGHCIFEYFGDFVRTSGPSMEPTLETNNLLATERMSKRFQLYDRGDIVIAKNPIEPKMLICKRIVGLPGDKIHMKPRINFNPFGSTKSEVTIDEKSLKDIMPFDDDDDREFDADKSKHINNQDSSMRTFRNKVICIPKGHVWLEGDNSENSIDSRTYGPVPMGLIQSRAVYRLYPSPTVF